MINESLLAVRPVDDRVMSLSFDKSSVLEVGLSLFSTGMRGSAFHKRLTKEGRFSLKSASTRIRRGFEESKSDSFLYRRFRPRLRCPLGRGDTVRGLVWFGLSTVSTDWVRERFRCKTDEGHRDAITISIWGLWREDCGKYRRGDGAAFMIHRR